MEAELKTKLDAIEDKLDTSNKHRETLCKLLHKPLDVHLEEAPKFRDKVVANGIWIIACWTLVILVIGRTLYAAVVRGPK